MLAPWVPRPGKVWGQHSTQSSGLTSLLPTAPSPLPFSVQGFYFLSHPSELLLTPQNPAQKHLLTRLGQSRCYGSFRPQHSSGFVPCPKLWGGGCRPFSGKPHGAQVHPTLQPAIQGHQGAMSASALSLGRGLGPRQAHPHLVGQTPGCEKGLSIRQVGVWTDSVCVH